ncbi:hypothetical protein OOU_Y34scaffold00681g1 [Pyricularia oryzae Y34]|uniref:Uncharacterized protein n=2 Tax=Pyricularia oryzae TaxID=318829 RepID=A0AA97NT77_PYRO3|nr:hypothetical protein OOU_Y34scaffold00681g1 [Pyricularia oryzae Y34]
MLHVRLHARRTGVAGAPRGPALIDTTTTTTTTTTKSQ